MARYALVLSGGGSRGAYELGVWKAIRELKLPIDIVTGTSIGALNGALVAQQQYEVAEQLWLNLDPSQVVKTEEKDPAVVFRMFLKDAFTGGADTSPLEHMLRDHVDEAAIRSSPIRYGLVTVRLPLLQPVPVTIEEIPQGQLVDYLMASATVYPLFRPKEIEGRKYIDGGFHDNMPINLAAEMGATHILAVDLKAVGRIQKIKNSKLNIIFIEPSRDLGSFLMFDKNLARRNQIVGYFDTMKRFSKLVGGHFTFRPQELNKLIESIRRDHHRMVQTILAGHPLAFFDTIRQLSKRRLFGHQPQKHNPTTAKRDLVRSLEIAGRIFELDDLTLYTAHQYRRALLRSVKEYRSMEQLHDREVDPNFDRLLTMDKRRRTIDFLDRIEHYARTKEGGTLLHALGMVHAEAMSAAISIYAIEQHAARKKAATSK
jgi:NTE family protein